MMTCLKIISKSTEELLKVYHKNFPKKYAVILLAKSVK